MSGANHLPPTGGDGAARPGTANKARIRTKRPMSAAMGPGGMAGNMGGPAAMKQAAAAAALDQELDGMYHRMVVLS